MQRVGRKVFFHADDGVTGWEPWKTDGTKQGTRRLRDIVPVGGSTPDDFVGYRRKVWFAATDASGDRELWRTNGTFKGTKRFKELDPTGSSSPRQPTVAGGVLYFEASDAAGNELWRSNGRKPGTRRVKDIRPGPIGSFPSEMAAFGRRLIFRADGSSGKEPWIHRP